MLGPELMRAWAGANLQAAAGKSLTTASQLVSDMAPGPAQNRACAAIFETWFAKGAGERDAAFEWVASLPDPAARRAAMESVERDWMWKDPQGVRDFISGPHGDLATREMVDRVAHHEAVRNPEAAMEWAGSLGANRAPGARRSVLASWLHTRPEAAAAYARTLPAGPDRASALRTVTTTLAWQSPEQAGAWIRSLSAAEQKAAREALDQDRVPEEKRRQIEAAATKP